MATRVQGEWLVAPVKRSVAKLLDKFDFNPSPELMKSSWRYVSLMHRGRILE